MGDLQVWQFILILFIELIVVAIATFILTRKLFARQLKKNPPINEKMVRAMLTQMGRTPSEKQVRAVMKSMEDAK
ncbi:MAG: YneF family protein [Anaeroplasmataceae bacterium]|nr:YneF family protein [Anaeroplasmataceae bacterium]